MTNKEIARTFNMLADLMELHEEDDFRIRSYRNAYLALRKTEVPLATLSETELKNIKGVGNAIASKITELLKTGKMGALEKYREKTPPGVVEMMEVNGFGPKKVRSVWHDMGIESIGELWYACNENRLVAFKGFGLKTQEDLKKKLEFYLKSRDKLHLDAAEEEADMLGAWLSGKLRGALVAPVGELRRRCPVIEKLEMLVGYNGEIDFVFDGETLTLEHKEGHTFTGRLDNNTLVYIHQCRGEVFPIQLFHRTGSDAFQKAFTDLFDVTGLDTEYEIFDKAGMAYIEPELRETADILVLAKNRQLPELVTEADLKGIVHVHTTYSDGLHSLRDMCTYARDLGYEYIGITDHSQSAFYANGLKPDRILEQWAEIDALNIELTPFRILKGIESDILSDGSLDYPDDMLAGFDFIVASVHSNLNMSKEKATERILRAVANPHTTILGHPTGRLLLGREGYPLDWDAIFDACAKHNVAIELNANPYRLDIDYTLIPEAVKRGIKIAINPDAHSKEGIHDVRYGVMAARKGSLQPDQLWRAV